MFGGSHTERETGSHTERETCLEGHILSSTPGGVCVCMCMHTFVSNF
jgi:hypothetical protein